MKGSVWMLAVLAALVATVKGEGVCYDPNHNNGASVAQDMALIKANGFSMVRTYISKKGNIDIAGIAAHSGLAATLGIPYAGNAAAVQDQKQAALNAAKDGNVQYIMVGNENLGDGASLPQDMLGLINEVKGALAQMGKNIPVGTVQKTAYFLSNAQGKQQLLSACDVVGVNIHPFFNGRQAVETAITETKRQWNAVSAVVGGKLILGETGWPSAGASPGGAQGSLDGAKKYFDAYHQWGDVPSSKRFYFQGFDQMYKPELFEKTYGIWTADGKPKFNGGGDGQGAPSQQTQAPTTTTPTPTKTTPAPTTAAPTTTVPAKNVTNTTTTTAPPLSNSSHAGSSSKDVAVVETIAHVTEEPSTIGVTKEDATIANAGDATPSAAGTQTTAAPGQETLPEANSVETRSASTGSSTLSVFIMTIFGVGIVAVAAGFVYKARQKAAELDRESKGDAMSITPGGACVL